MPNETYRNSHIAVSSVEEKINVEKRLPFDPNNKKGPTTDLYFHELPSEQTAGQQILQLFVGLFLGACFFTTLPILTLYIKTVSTGPVFNKTRHTGKRGRVFDLITYRLTDNQSSKPYIGAQLLEKSGIYKLPAILNMWKGNLNLVGPRPYPEEWCNRWNKELSDFYKRFALNPGLLSITPALTKPTNAEEVMKMLKRELPYIVNPTLNKDFKRILGRYQ